MDATQLLILNYMPYAKTTITSRAIAEIDGLKPVQRRILYTAFLHKLHTQEALKTKSANLVGAVMKLHPNGDSAIYDALVRMSTGNEALNVPLIESKGNFGKVYSRDMQYAAPRYTEVKLAPITREIFDSMNEDAVQMVPNYDNSTVEPSLLPVKFPSILVNSSNGVAVGKGSAIPTFSLTNACQAVIGRLNGSIKDFEALAKALGQPEFSTGAFLHCSPESLQKLCETGKGSFVISGKVELYNNKIVVVEIPYNTTTEDIADCIGEAIKEKKLIGVKDINDDTGLNEATGETELRLTIELKNGYNSREIAEELFRITPLRSTVSFKTNVIIKGRCHELNLMELIDEWIDFRQETINRIYNFRLKKYSSEEHMLSLWEKISGRISEVVKMIADHSESEAKEILISKYGLDEAQADVLLDMKIRSITNDRAKKSLDKLKEIRDTITEVQGVISDVAKRYAIIINELNDIIKKYGKGNHTKAASEIDPNEERKKIEISDEQVTVIMTKEGYLRRLTSIRDIATKFERGGDVEIKRWAIKNNEYLLVFDRFGTVHKILVDSIDASTRANLTDRVNELAGVEKLNDIIWVDAAGDYSGYFNLITPFGKGQRVYYNKAQGNRSKYISLYEPVNPGAYFVTQSNEFFCITKKNKAAYCDITMLGLISNRSAFKVARVNSGDYFVRLVPKDKVPYPHMIDFDRYSKDYTVSIGDDYLYYDPEREQKMKEALEYIKHQRDILDSNAENSGENA